MPQVASRPSANTLPYQTVPTLYPSQSTSVAGAQNHHCHRTYADPSSLHHYQHRRQEYALQVNSSCLHAPAPYFVLCLIMYWILVPYGDPSLSLAPLLAVCDYRSSESPAIYAGTFGGGRGAAASRAEGDAPRAGIRAPIPPKYTHMHEEEVEMGTHASI